jgi:hypothetical protein
MVRNCVTVAVVVRVEPAIIHRVLSTVAKVVIVCVRVANGVLVTVAVNELVRVTNIVVPAGGPATLPDVCDTEVDGPAVVGP